MIRKFWKRIGKWGMSLALTPQQRRAVYIANRLALILFILNLTSGVAIYLSSGVVRLSILVITSSLLYVAALFINRSGHIDTGRMLICIFLPVSSLALSIYGKVLTPPGNQTSYFTTRAVLLVAAILPLVVFSIRERKYIIVGLIVSFFGLLLFDPIHELCGVGYEQMGFDITSYGFMHFIMLMLYTLLVVAFFYYKLVLERAERKSKKNNQKLRKLYANQEDQNHQIKDQSVALQKSQAELTDAYTLISNQNELLNTRNQELRRHLEEKNLVLKNSNIELYKRLEGLKQFSYTISHNLRGPIATLLGLAKLFDRSTASADNLQLINHIQTSTEALDLVIRDLSEVLEMQKEGATKEKVNLQTLLDDVLIALEEAIDECNSEIILELEVENVLAVKSYMHSILYNILSNAFKYCDPSRKGIVRVRTIHYPHEVLIEIEDNGIGIDLEQHGNSLFKMYRRFSNSRKGRGLGLYLTKVQTESMGGRIVADSKPQVGTKFRIYLPQY